MKNSFFLKKSHISIIPHVITAYMIIIAFVILYLVKDSKLSMILIFVIIFSTVITSVIIKYERSMGLYISGMDISYKTIKSRKINIHEIVGVKIIQSYSTGKYRGFYPMKNQKGELLYSVFFLKSLTEEMFNYKKRRYMV